MKRYSLFSAIYDYCLLVPVWVIFLSFPKDTIASDIIGDINDNGVVNLEEAIYALQVSAGLTPSIILDPDSEPNVAAWGTYTYDSDILTVTFTFSNFSSGGPPVGTFPLTVNLLTDTEMVFTPPGGDTESWAREPGDPSDIVGEWERTDSDGNLIRVILDANGSLLYTAKGDFYTNIVDVPYATMTIDGSFTDWSGINALTLYQKDSDCGGDAGRDIDQFYIAYDDEYIYIRMDIDGQPEVPLFDYKFGKWIHSRVTPPPSVSCHLSSNICQGTGCTAAFGNDNDSTEDQYEARIDKCLVEPWGMNGGYPVWIDQGEVTICRTHYKTAPLNIDFSNCD